MTYAEKVALQRIADATRDAITRARTNRGVSDGADLQMIFRMWDEIDQLARAGFPTTQEIQEMRP